jgi:hypothetical protein
MTKLTAKEEFEAEEFSEKAGMISIYVCEGCKLHVLYSYIASGITPIKLTCVKCSKIMWVVPAEEIVQPNRVWYRPESVLELERLALLAYETGIKEGHYAGKKAEDVIAMILDMYVDHYNNGKLFAKLLDLKE